MTSVVPGGRDDLADGAPFVVAMAALEPMSPRLLNRVLDHHAPEEAWARLRAGKPLAAEALGRARRTTFDRLVACAADVDPVALCERCDELGVTILVRGDPRIPGVLARDVDPPPVLFVRGALHQLGRRRVAIVGTRNATAAGRETAFELGEGLAQHDVAVVSGLARGIDGAAHRGVRSVRDAGDGRCGGAVAVVGSGIDVPYPRQHRELWEWVATDGLLISEWPPGVQADAWRFPLRNRIIAALSEVVVVVESRARGGSLITADLATERSIPVMVVPGSVRAPSAAGTNKLASEGQVQLVTSVDDVLVALGLHTSRASGEPGVAFGRRPRRSRPAFDDHTVEARVYALCADRPSTLDDLVGRLGVSIAEAAMAAARLERDGWISDSGGWFEPARSKLHDAALPLGGAS